ncbi:FUSC family protein [Flavobacterium sp. HXWNR69]|uniref:FUSC family protein n=1 Tax=Flavobacterium fragile TaxID=2949085 RepID=A0ABT0TH53_9FLAO|nr:FUSC family protein [Flavobacterium sp. HXWNR69]MCL9770305.1 FUSC family protein [Flavobacterium sp. HXWNR69]
MNTIRKKIQLFFELKPNKRSHHIPYLAAICVGFPLFLGYIFNAIPMGLLASLGGLVILYYQPNLSFASRMITLLFCSLGFVFSLGIGLSFSFNPFASSISLGLFAMLIHWLTTYFKIKPPGNFFFIMIASVASCQEFHVDVIPEKIGFLFLGTMLACFFALLHSLLLIQNEIPSLAFVIQIKKGKFVSLIDSVIVGFFIFISFVIGYLFKIQNPYWIPISCLAIMQGISKQHVWERMVHRIMGTFIGIGLCWLILAFFKTPLTICISIFILQFLVEFLITRNYALAMIFITPMTILLAEIGSSFTTNTEIIVSTRFLDIIIGSILGAIGGWFMFHQQFKHKATQQLRKTSVKMRKK